MYRKKGFSWSLANMNSMAFLVYLSVNDVKSTGWVMIYNANIVLCLYYHDNAKHTACLVSLQYRTILRDIKYIQLLKKH